MADVRLRDSKGRRAWTKMTEFQECKRGLQSALSISSEDDNRHRYSMPLRERIPRLDNGHKKPPAIERAARAKQGQRAMSDHAVMNRVRTIAKQANVDPVTPYDLRLT